MDWGSWDGGGEGDNLITPFLEPKRKNFLGPLPWSLDYGGLGDFLIIFLTVDPIAPI